MKKPENKRDYIKIKQEWISSQVAKSSQEFAMQALIVAYIFLEEKDEHRVQPVRW